MNTDNYNKALDKLARYRCMAGLAELGTPTFTSYIDKLEAGTSILAIACDKFFEEVYCDVRKAYDSKYRY